MLAVCLEDRGSIGRDLVSCCVGEEELVLDSLLLEFLDELGMSLLELVVQDDGVVDRCLAP